MKKAPTFHRRLRRRLNLSQNFRKPRAFGARTPLLGAFGPQKWEYPPPTLAEKNLGDDTKKSPRTGFSQWCSEGCLRHLGDGKNVSETMPRTFR